MPDHLVASALAAGTLVSLFIAEGPTPRDGLTIYTAHRRDRALGPAGCWLLDKLRLGLPLS